MNVFFIVGVIVVLLMSLSLYIWAVKTKHSNYRSAASILIGQTILLLAASHPNKLADFAYYLLIVSVPFAISYSAHLLEKQWKFFYSICWVIILLIANMEHYNLLVQIP